MIEDLEKGNLLQNKIRSLAYAASQELVEFIHQEVEGDDEKAFHASYGAGMLSAIVLLPCVNNIGLLAKCVAHSMMSCSQALHDMLEIGVKQGDISARALTVFAKNLKEIISDPEWVDLATTFDMEKIDAKRH